MPSHFLLNPSSRWYYPLRWSLLIALGLAVYYQTFGFGFVFDDHEFIINNPYIRSFDKINGLWAILPKTRLIGVYSFALNYYFNHLDPRGYHIFNFIVHLLVAGLVWGASSVMIKIAGGLRPSSDWLAQELPFIIAAIFLVHPCQTQAVTYISQRFELMAAFFYLSTVYCYLCARLSPLGRGKIVLFILAFASAILGLLTKEETVTLALMLLAVEWILLPEKISHRQIVWILAIGSIFYCLLFMKLVHGGFNILFQAVPSQSHDGDIVHFGNYVLTQMRVFLTFCRLLVFPVHQNFDYDYPLSAGILHPPLTLAGMGLIGVMIVLVFKLRRDFPLISFGLAWMLITFSINLVPRANIIWEHKLYLISFGFFLLLAVSLNRLVQNRVVLAWLLIGLIAALSMAGFQRNQVWKNELVLWEDVVKKSSGKERVYANLGLAYGRSQQYDKAIYFLNKAIAMNPKDYKSHMNIGEVYFRLGSDSEALAHFNEAINIDPFNFGLYVKRARVYKKQMNLKAAFADLGHSLSLRPNVEAYLERGLLWMAQEHPQEALQDIEQVLQLQPDNYEALINRAGVYFCTGRYMFAIKDLDWAQSIDHNDFRIYKDRALCFYGMGKENEALKDVVASLILNPGDAQMAALYREILHLK